MISYLAIQVLQDESGPGVQHHLRGPIRRFKVVIEASFFAGFDVILHLFLHPLQGQIILCIPFPDLGIMIAQASKFG